MKKYSSVRRELPISSRIFTYSSSSVSAFFVPLLLNSRLQKFDSNLWILAKSLLRWGACWKRLETKASPLCNVSQDKRGVSASSQGLGTYEILSRMSVSISAIWVKAICGRVSWRAFSSWSVPSLAFLSSSPSLSLSWAASLFFEFYFT